MSKTDNRPTEKMSFTIEFADNGIILRDSSCDDIVTLVLSKRCESGYGVSGMSMCIGDTDHTDEYAAIGKKVYDWLKEVGIVCHSGDWITTGAELYITAVLNGRAR